MLVLMKNDEIFFCYFIKLKMMTAKRREAINLIVQKIRGGNQVGSNIGQVKKV